MSIRKCLVNCCDPKPSYGKICDCLNHNIQFNLKPIKIRNRSWPMKCMLNILTRGYSIQFQKIKRAISLSRCEPFRCVPVYGHFIREKCLRWKTIPKYYTWFLNAQWLLWCKHINMMKSQTNSPSHSCKSFSRSIGPIFFAMWCRCVMEQNPHFSVSLFVPPITEECASHHHLHHMHTHTQTHNWDGRSSKCR